MLHMPETNVRRTVEAANHQGVAPHLLVQPEQHRQAERHLHNRMAGVKPANVPRRMLLSKRTTSTKWQQSEIALS